MSAFTSVKVYSCSHLSLRVALSLRALPTSRVHPYLNGTRQIMSQLFICIQLLDVNLEICKTGSTNALQTGSLLTGYQLHGMVKTRDGKKWAEKLDTTLTCTMLRIRKL